MIFVVLPNAKLNSLWTFYSLIDLHSYKRGLTCRVPERTAAMAYLCTADFVRPNKDLVDI